MSVRGHQVAIRFKAMQLRMLDALVARAQAKASEGPYRGGRFNAGRTRSGVIIDLVEQAAKGLSLGPAKRDERQLELLEERRSELLEHVVDQVERSAKRLQQRSKPTKKKAPRGAPQKPRAAKPKPKSTKGGRR